MLDHWRHNPLKEEALERPLVEVEEAYEWVMEKARRQVQSSGLTKGSGLAQGLESARDS
jgi:hypothetical protein